MSFNRLLTVVLAAAFASAAQADVIFVDDDAPPGGDGVGWATAYRFLQDALAEAGVPGSGISEIRVAQGAYLPDRHEVNPAGTGDREATFRLINGVAILGGFAGLGANDPDERDIEAYVSVLSGDLGGDDASMGDDACCVAHDTPGCSAMDPLCEGLVCSLLPFCCEVAWDTLCVAVAAADCDDLLVCAELNDNSFHVATGDGTNQTASLDGFTVTAGNADSSLPHRQGGGLVIDSGSPEIARCTFTGNFAEWGAGIFSVAGDPAVADCLFIGNIARGAGGGFFVEDGDPAVMGCTFVDNASGFSIGGMLVFRGAPTISQCTFSENAAPALGGGVGIDDASPLIVECNFLGNTAGFSGGGAVLIGLESSPTLMECLFSGNIVTGAVPGGSPNGGGVAVHDAAPLVVGSTFEDNLVSGPTGAGGGLSVSSTPGLDLVGCTFRANGAFAGGAIFGRAGWTGLRGCAFVENAAALGGGVYRVGGDEFRVADCSFSANTASEDGGAHFISDVVGPQYVNCVFSGNTAGGNGGAVFHDGSGSAEVVNCTFSGNEAIAGGGGWYDAGQDLLVDEVSNCILWGDSPDEIAGPSEPLVRWSDVQGGWPGTGNIDADPLFVDPDNADFRLSAGSPCIDAGDNTSVPEGIDTDLDGNPRFVDDPDTVDTGYGDPPLVDMGAFEFQLLCPWDLNGNGFVWIIDFLLLLFSWGPCDGCPADFDGNGYVGVTDLLDLLCHFGPCP